MSAKYGLIIGNTEYTDPGLAQLTAPGKDTEDFARVLRDKNLCAFDEVKVLLDQPESVVREAIDEFFDQKRPDDLLVLYFSGHGVRDEMGALYLATKNTNRFRLRSTAIKSDYIRDVMDESRSKRQLLILDCCNSGAFTQGTKAATGVSIGTFTAFQGGYGRIILTASDSTQFAWEGNKVIGETDNSLFTHFLVKRLEGEADLDSDGTITADELYDYTYDKVRFVTPKQTPSKFSTKQQGEIILRQIVRIEDIKPVPLPDELIEEIEDGRPYVREAAVQKLERILQGKNMGQVRSARVVLETIAKNDDSRRVSQAALRALAAVHQEEQSPIQSVEEDIVKPKVEFERSSPEKHSAFEQSDIEIKQRPEVQPQIRLPAKPEDIKKTEPAKNRFAKIPVILIGIAGVATLALCILGYGALSLLPGIFGSITATITPSAAAIPSKTSSPLPGSTSPGEPSTTAILPNSGACETPAAFVKARVVNLRDGPDLRFYYLGEYHLNDEFLILGHYLGWYNVEFPDGKRGWLYIDWISIPPEVDPDNICTIAYKDLPPTPKPSSNDHEEPPPPPPVCSPPGSC